MTKIRLRNLHGFEVQARPGLLLHSGAAGQAAHQDDGDTSDLCIESGLLACPVWVLGVHVAAPLQEAIRATGGKQLSGKI